MAQPNFDEIELPDSQDRISYFSIGRWLMIGNLPPYQPQSQSSKRGVEPLEIELSFEMVSSSASNPAFGGAFKGICFEVHNANNGSDEDPGTFHTIHTIHIICLAVSRPCVDQSQPPNLVWRPPPTFTRNHKHIGQLVSASHFLTQSNQ
jgi:hypothetical protein